MALIRNAILNYQRMGQEERWHFATPMPPRPKLATPDAFAIILMRMQPHRYHISPPPSRYAPGPGAVSRRADV